MRARDVVAAVAYEVVMTNVVPSWWLFHRVVDDVVVEFAEIVVVDDRAVLRTGKVLTWGISEEIDDVDAVRNRLLTSGYIVTRRWHFDPVVFDDERFLDELASAAHTAFSALREQHPGLNAFALQTDDGAMTIGAVAHAFADDDDDDDSILLDPSAWSVQDMSVVFDVVYRLILSQHRDDLSLVGFDQFRAAFDAAVIRALSILRDKGVFGDNDDVTIIYDITDGEPVVIASRRR